MRSRGKKEKAIPPPQEATDCIKVTTVYDNEGHFEFSNLKRDDYSNAYDSDAGASIKK